MVVFHSVPAAAYNQTYAIYSPSCIVRILLPEDAWRVFSPSAFSNWIDALTSLLNVENEYCSTFSSQDIKFENQEFQGANLTAVFGGVRADLRNAVINEEQVINCSAIFGSIEIIPSDEINIKVKSTSIFGGVSNSRKNKEINNELKTVYINAMCLFGGVSIKWHFGKK